MYAKQCARPLTVRSVCGAVRNAFVIVGLGCGLDPTGINAKFTLQINKKPLTYKLQGCKIMETLGQGFCC